jgi:hypothetical protein
MLARLLASQNYAIISIPIAKAVGLEAAFLLHHLLSHYDFFAKSNQLIEHKGQSFFYATVDDIEEKTTLSKERQATAIKKLLEAGLIEQSNFGVPCRRHFAIPEHFESVLFQLAGKPLTGSRESRQLDSEKSANCTAEKPPTINSIKNSIKDNTFSKEKDISVFSEKNLESENQPQPQIQKEKKERTQPPPTPPAEKTKVQHFNADQIKAVNKPMFVSSNLWTAFIDAVICGLPNQTPKNKIAVGRFNTWIERLEKEAATYSEPALLEIIQAYKVSQDPNLREGKNAWLSIFHSDFTNHIQRIEKNLKITTQNQNSQNGTTNQSNSERFEYKPGQVREYFAKTNGLSGL